MTFRLRLAVLGIALAVAGCVATDLSQLNTRYDDLLARKSALGPLPDSPDATYVLDNENIETGFKSLAADATKAAGDAKEPATKIVALRLAAVAAWQAKDTTAYIAAQGGGSQACQQIPAGATGAPRDCAILNYLPVLRAYEEAAARADSIFIAADNATIIKNANALLANLREVLNSQSLILPSIVDGQGIYSGISPTTQKYFKKVAVASACLAESIALNGAGLRPDSAEKTAMVNSARALAQSYLPLVVLTGRTNATSTDWYNKPGNCPRVTR